MSKKVKEKTTVKSTTSTPVQNPLQEATFLLQKSLKDSVKLASEQFANYVETMEAQFEALETACLESSASEVIVSIDETTKSVADFRLNMATRLSSLKDAAKVIRTLQGPSEDEKAERSAYNKRKRLERIEKAESEKAA